MHALRTLAAAATLAAAFSPAAQAKLLLFSSYTPNFTFSTPTAMIPLGGTAASPVTLLNVNAPSAGRYLLAYSAECDAASPDGGWLDIDLLVNGVAVDPTAGNADAFCAGALPNAFGGWSRPSITVAARLRAGNNTIQVRARLDGGTTMGFFGDSAVVVHQ